MNSLRIYKMVHNTDTFLSEDDMKMVRLQKCATAGVIWYYYYYYYSLNKLTLKQYTYSFS
jgi:hypothetical protein